MGDFTFTVTVAVTGWEDPGDGRTELDYARAALNVADLPDASRLDGFADLAAEADLAGFWP